MDLVGRKEAYAPEIGETFVTAQYGAGVVSPDISVRGFDVLHAVCTFVALTPSRKRHLCTSELPIAVTKIYSVFGCTLSFQRSLTRNAHCLYGSDGNRL